MRYIELNPVIAKMVQHPGEYQWSSYHVNAQPDEKNFIIRHPVYDQLGNTAAERQAAYRELFREVMNDDSIHQIRDSLNHELVLGRSDFKDKIEEMTNRQTRLGKPGRPCVKEEDACYYIFE